MKILAIDVGGTGLKAALIDSKGKLISKRVRVDTPSPCPPKVMVEALLKLVEPFTGYTRIAVGFPGVVRGTKVITAPHFGNDIWAGFDLGGTLSRKLKKPLRMINDAEMQGLAVVKGKGLEVVITLGTGFGSAVFEDGELSAHLEMAHHPIHGKDTYNEYIGDKALKKIGKKKWNHRMKEILPVLHTFFNYDHLYIGGGNAKKLDFKLPPKTSIVSNAAGIEGGAMLWKLKRR
ncbi:MAG TPA: ROK family protein [Rhizomicrobium sp.]|jgi:polyphosphate glucokinase|nr:ROK family protein [Rhizomicrobium sp.]